MGGWRGSLTGLLQPIGLRGPLYLVLLSHSHSTATIAANILADGEFRKRRATGNEGVRLRARLVRASILAMPA